MFFTINESNGIAIYEQIIRQVQLENLQTSSKMNLKRYDFIAAFAATLAAIFGCSRNTDQHSRNSVGVGVQASSSREIKVDPPNEFGYANISIRDGDTYLMGIVDAQGNEVVQPGSSMLVNDITGKLALVQLERKFLFVPLDQGFVSSEDLDSVDGFQYAEPYRCGLAMVSINDSRFYIGSNCEKAFDSDFEFAKSFHHDRALVKDDGRYRIIDTEGKTVAGLIYDQISLQSSWCWQVTKIDQGPILAALRNAERRLSDFILSEIQ